MNPQNTTEITTSQFIQGVIPVKGRPIDLNGYLPFKTIYDINPPSMVIKSSRQVGKSLFTGLKLLSKALLTNFSVSLYVAPLSAQTGRFSSMYLDPFINAPLVKKHWTDASTKKNVYEKSLSNGATIYLGYADTADATDRLRGISVSGPGPNGATVCLDEIQDIQMDALDIIMETMSAAERPTKLYTGTAKTENNSLEILWKRSNQMEWCVKCDHCARWAIPVDFDVCMKIVAGVDGPICPHCSHGLDMSKGQWLAGKASEKNFMGFHTPAFAMPIRNKKNKWDELQEKVKHYQAGRLANEVFGLCSGIGLRILSIREAQACCNPLRTSWDTGFPEDDRRILFTVIGVDWAVSSSVNSAYTVVSVLGYDSQGKCFLLYSQKMDGVDILDQVQRVEELYHKYKCSAIGSDRGVGVPQGQLMQRHIGQDRVNMINYVSAKHHLRWDKDGLFFAADRTMNIDTFMFKAKAGISKLETPCWNLTEQYWQDAMNVYEEESHTGKRLYRKDEGMVDDWLHSMVFGNIAAMILRGDFISIDEHPDKDNLFTFDYS
jgi:hypothetical protein